MCLHNTYAYKYCMRDVFRMYAYIYIIQVEVNGSVSLQNFF